MVFRRLTLSLCRTHFRPASLKRSFDSFDEIKIENLKGQFSRFDFGKVQNIIYNRQQILPAGADGIDDFALSSNLGWCLDNNPDIPITPFIGVRIS